MRRAPRPPRQHSQAPALPEHPEAARGPHAVLESKVKALKEKRGAGRPGAPTAAPERPSPKKPRPRRGKPGMDVAAVEPRAQLRTYLTDGLLDGGDTAAGGPLSPRAGTPGLWRVPAPRGEVPGVTELPCDEGGRSQGSASPPATPPLEEEAQTTLRDRGRPSASPSTAEGWERLSLAERVERNRRLLQEVLGLAAAGACFGQIAAVSVEPGGAGRRSFGAKGGLRCRPPASHAAGTAPRWLMPRGCPVPPWVLCLLHRQLREMPINKTGCCFTGVPLVPSGVLVRDFTAKSKSETPFLGHSRSASIIFPLQAATRKGN